MYSILGDNFEVKSGVILRTLRNIEYNWKFNILFKVGDVVMYMRLDSNLNSCFSSFFIVFFIESPTVQYNTIQYNTIQYNAIQCNTIQYSYPSKTSRISYDR